MAAVIQKLFDDIDVYMETDMMNKNKISVEICMCSVPQKLRKLEDAYNPRLVSIGPFHSNKYHLEPMSRHKRSYMAALLGVKTTQDIDQLSCGWSNSLDKLIGQCYVSEAMLGTGDMLIDGCFILELFLRLAPSLNYITPQEHQSDPVINSAWMIRALYHDLVLLENQIPFFILEMLYHIIKPRIMSKCKAPESVTSLASSFFKPMMSYNSTIGEHSYTDCRHLLDLLHKSSLLAASGVGDTTAFAARVNDERVILGNLTLRNQYWGSDYCASELAQSGVEFCKESEDSLVNITAMRSGQLINIPPVFIDEVRDSLFRNLIAYEQCGMKTSNHVTSYAILMKSLIRSPRDVKLLRKKGIISQNWIEDEEYVTQFKSLLDGVVPKDFYFVDLCDQVKAYASKFWIRRKMHSLYRKYFSTAWSLISFIAAICLFILTVIQTYFAINPRS